MNSATELVASLLRGGPRPPGTQELDGGPLRTTLRLPVADQTVVAKLFHPRRDVGELLRTVLRPSRPRTEFRNLEIAGSRGLPVPAPLDVVRAGPLRSALILEDLGTVTPLDELANVAPEQSRGVLWAAGRLLRQALDAGLDHRDLHLGNLVRRDVGGELFLLDLHRARFRDGAVALSPSMRRSLFLSLPWPDQLPLREALATELDDRALDPHDWEALVTRHVHGRAARCRRSSGPFIVEGAHRRRRGGPHFAPPVSTELPRAQAVERFENAFLLEVHGIPTARALALEPLGTDRARVSLESTEGFQPVPPTQQIADEHPWLLRLRLTGHGELAARLQQLHNTDGRTLLVLPG